MGVQRQLQLGGERKKGPLHDMCGPVKCCTVPCGCKPGFVLTRCQLLIGRTCPVFWRQRHTPGVISVYHID